MKYFKLLLFSATAVILMTPAPRVPAQDVPGFSLGGFYEYRAENEINDQDLSFHYYGARIQFRDARWINFFIDGGGESMDLDQLESASTGAFGLGGTFWLMRQEYGAGPLDLGLFGSMHFASYSSVRVKNTGLKTDIKHYQWLAQVMVRGLLNENFGPFLRGGIQGSKIDPDDDIGAGGDEDATTVALNTGVEIIFEQDLVLTLELNYYDNIGGGIHLDYWF
jgi:hypothetical protein